VWIDVLPHLLQILLTDFTSVAIAKFKKKKFVKIFFYCTVIVYSVEWQAKLWRVSSTYIYWGLSDDILLKELNNISRIGYWQKADQTPLRYSNVIAAYFRMSALTAVFVICLYELKCFDVCRYHQYGVMAWTYHIYLVAWYWNSHVNFTRSQPSWCCWELPRWRGLSDTLVILRGAVLREQNYYGKFGNTYRLQ
jgi:hypothetical protein